MDLQHASAWCVPTCCCLVLASLAAERLPSRAIFRTEESNFTRFLALLGEVLTTLLTKLKPSSSALLAFALVQGKAGGDVTIRVSLFCASFEFEPVSARWGTAFKTCSTARLAPRLISLVTLNPPPSSIMHATKYIFLDLKGSGLFEYGVIWSIFTISYFHCVTALIPVYTVKHSLTAFAASSTKH